MSLRLVHSVARSAALPHQKSADSGPDQNAPGAERLRAKWVEQLYIKYRGSLLRYLRAKCASDEDAAEILQETYLRLLKTSQTDRLNDDSQAYLYTIASNLIIDRYRYNNARRVASTDVFDEELMCGNEPDPALQLQWDRAALALKQHLRELPPRCRQVFLMRRFRDLSSAEIAEVLGTSKRTVERELVNASEYFESKIGMEL